MKILAIETSHDDTSLSLYEDKKIIFEVNTSQTDFHKQYGGTIPEYASRGHFVNLYDALEQMKEHDLSSIDYIALTVMPGLVGSLNMGKVFANALAITLEKEIIEVNHMHGHIFAIEFNHQIKYPALALIVSGGHTQLWNVRSPIDVEIIGQTKDDAAGEVFDKIARKLELGFPGGPVIDRIHATYEGDYIDFSLKDDLTFDFSFSGLKTKVTNYINNNQLHGFNTNQVAASFQHHIVDYLISKTKHAIEEFKPASVIIGGGVSANDFLRKRFAKLHEFAFIPEKKYCTDNASMIAICAHLQHEEESKNTLISE